MKERGSCECRVCIRERERYDKNIIEKDEEMGWQRYWRKNLIIGWVLCCVGEIREERDNLRGNMKKK